MSVEPCTLADFKKIDLRIGKVIDAAPLEGSKKLLRLQVDFGPEQEPRTILTGILAWYAPEDLINKQFVFVTNLEPKEMAGVRSEGMLLCAGTAERAILIPVADTIPTGTIVR